MCGIVGIWNIPKAAEHAALAAHAIQHRARDSAGIITTDGAHAYRHAERGMVSHVFTQEILDKLHGRNAIAHIRYSTVEDDAQRDNTQPIEGIFNNSWIGVAHNGNLTNVEEVKNTLLPGEMFATSMDTECVVRLIAHENGEGTVIEKINHALAKVRGSFSLTILLPDRLLAVRDWSGNRPLVWGIHHDGYVVASESCALTAIGVTDHVEVERGTIVSFSNNGVEIIPLAKVVETPKARCVFEHVYFSLPTSKVFGISTTSFRVELGKELARESGADADVVIPIPDSSNPIAMGYAEGHGQAAYEPFAILRNHYTGRSFIASTPELRSHEIARKFLFDPDKIEGRRIVLIDDSIVRLNTLPKVVASLMEIGAKEIHVRIGCPTITHPCTYGINTPSKSELIASHKSVEEMRELCGATSLAFLSHEGLRRVVDKYDNNSSYCYACIDGKYPLPK